MSKAPGAVGRSMGAPIAHPPRGPVLASSEVASYYVQYGRGPLGVWFFFFAVLAFAFAVVCLLSFSDSYSAGLLFLIGTTLAALGVLSYFWTPRETRRT
jgi:hypothetical protein